MFRSIFVLLFLSGLVFSQGIIFSDFSECSEIDLNSKIINEEENFSFRVNSVNGVFPELRSLPDNASYLNGTFSWTPSKNQGGLYRLDFYYIENNKIIYQDMILTVSNTNTTIPVNEAYENIFVPRDKDGDDVEITIEGAPAGSTFVGDIYGVKLFSWTPTLSQKGVHIFYIKLTDFPEIGDSKTVTTKITMTVSELKYDEMQYDFNDDGKIDMQDFNLMAAKWLKGATKNPA